MRHLAFGLLLIAFLILLVTNVHRSNSTEYVFDCSAWPSVEKCIREGIAPNWEQFEARGAIKFIKPEETR